MVDDQTVAPVYEYESIKNAAPPSAPKVQISPDFFITLFCSFARDKHAPVWPVVQLFPFLRGLPRRFLLVVCFALCPDCPCLCYLPVLCSMAFLARNKKSRAAKDPPIYAVPYESHAYSSRPPSSMSTVHTPDASRTSFSSPEYNYSRSSHRPSMSGNADDLIPSEDIDRAKERVGKMAMGADDSESESASESATIFKYPQRTINHKRSLSNRSHVSTTRDSTRNEFGAVQVDPEDAHATIVSATSSKMSLASAWSAQQRTAGSTSSVYNAPPRPPSRNDKSLSHRPSLTQSVNSFQSRASRSSQHSSYSGFSQPGATPSHMPTEMPRPPADAVDRLFRALIEQRQRDSQGPIPIDDMLNWSVEKKWQLVKDNQVGDHRFDVAMKGRSKKDRPEYYLSKFLDGTINVKTIGSLNVGLRTYELPYVN